MLFLPFFFPEIVLVLFRLGDVAVASIVVSLLFSHRVIFGFLEMGAPLNLPLFPYPLMFAFNNELKDPSFSFSLLFTLISRSTLGGNTMRFFQTCRGIMHITHLFPLILLYGLHFPLCFALPSFKKNWTVLCLFCVIHGQFIRWLAVYKGFNFIKIDALLFYTFSLSHSSLHY